MNIGQKCGKNIIMDTKSQTKTIELKTVRFSTSLVASNYAMEHFTDEYLKNRLLYQLDAYIASKTIEEYAFRAPANWWEAVKERFAPEWWLTRRPIEYRIERIDAVALYPSIPLKDREPYILVYENNTSFSRET